MSVFKKGRVAAANAAVLIVKTKRTDMRSDIYNFDQANCIRSHNACDYGALQAKGGGKIVMPSL